MTWCTPTPRPWKRSRYGAPPPSCTAVNLAAMLPVIEKSSARAPHNTGLLRGLAGLHERLGQPEQARECYDRIILVSDKPEERLWAQKQEDSARLKN